MKQHDAKIMVDNSYLGLDYHLVVKWLIFYLRFLYGKKMIFLEILICLLVKFLGCNGLMVVISLIICLHNYQILSPMIFNRNYLSIFSYRTSFILIIIILKLTLYAISINPWYTYIPNLQKITSASNSKSC